MVGWPQAEAQAISRGGAHDLRILHRDRSTKLHEVDTAADRGRYVEQVFGLAEGKAWITWPCRTKGVDKAGILQQQIGREALEDRIRGIIRVGIAITDQHHRHVRVGGGLRSEER